jgi:hypothetical protein
VCNVLCVYVCVCVCVCVLVCVWVCVCDCEWNRIWVIEWVSVGLSVQAEAERQKHAAVGSSEGEKGAAMRIAAALNLDEQHDEVKRMNQMILYSKCMSERYISPPSLCKSSA